MNYYEIVKNSTNHLDRCEVASAKDCPIDLLSMFITNDSEFDVVKAAALNLICSTELLDLAIRNIFQTSNNLLRVNFLIYDMILY